MTAPRQAERTRSAAVRIAAVATAVPEHVLTQEDAIRIGEKVFAAHRETFERLRPAYGNAGVAQRYSCQPADWYAQECDWKTRNDLYLRHARSLLARAGRAALETSGLDPAAIDAVVTVSTTGIATPSLEARLLGELGLREDVERLPIFGLGCAGGALGLARAAALAQTRPGRKVLLLVVELCALTFRQTDCSKANVIATALFGDGAAAAVLINDGAADPGRPAIRGWGEHTWRDSLGVMGWSVENDGLGVIFSRDIPALIAQRFGPATDRYLAGQGLSRQALDGVICHPGGAKVIAALEESFGLASGTMSDARAVLRDYGNMSAATVLFVLARVMRREMTGTHLLSALGPGFTAAYVTLEAGQP